MVILRNSSYICNIFTFDKTYIATIRHFVASYYLNSASNIFLTLQMQDADYIYGGGGGAVDKGTFEIYGRQYA